VYFEAMNNVPRILASASYGECVDTATDDDTDGGGESLTLSGQVDDPGILDVITLTIEVDLNFDGDTDDPGETVSITVAPNGTLTRFFELTLSSVPDDGATYENGARIWGNETDADALPINLIADDGDGGLSETCSSLLVGKRDGNAVVLVSAERLAAGGRKNESTWRDIEMASSTCGTVMTKVLVVEPDPMYRKLFPIWIRDHFGGLGLQVASVCSVREAEETSRRWRPDVLLTAYELEEGTDGLSLAQRLRPIGGELRVIVVSQAAYSRLRRRLANSPLTQFLAKPVGEKTFVEVVEAALHGPVASQK
jgi:CheY-like chemotaxis protein